MGNWLITGCSSGIGLGVAKAALDTGANVVACARRVEPMKSLVREFPESCHIVSLDVTDPDSRINSFNVSTEMFGAVDVLVNCAGSGYRAAIEEGPLKALEDLMRVNVYGPLEMAKLVLPGMRKRKSGTIVDVTSIGGVRGARCNGYYSASKAALEMIDDALRAETAGLGIKVITVEPGAFRTGFYESLEGPTTTIPDYDEVIGDMRVGLSSQPRNQAGDPMAAGRVIVKAASLASPPEGLSLGSDALQILRTEYEKRLLELDRFSDISRSTDFK